MAMISYAIQFIVLLSVLSVNPISLICPSLFPFASFWFCLWVYFCFAYTFICIFKDFIYSVLFLIIILCPKSAFTSGSLSKSGCHDICFQTVEKSFHQLGPPYVGK